MKRAVFLNRRVVFKLHGMDPLDATVLRQDETGYWIRGGTLAEKLDAPVAMTTNGHKDHAGAIR